MRGELERYQPQELSRQQPDAREISPEARSIEASQEAVNELYRSAEHLPKETRELLQRLCLTQGTILEEQLHAMNPEQHPQETIGGDVYKHRNEALMHLDHVVRKLQSRDIRTIDASHSK